MNIRMFLLLSTIPLLIHCDAPPANDSIEKVAEDYFEVYAQRSDFDALMEFYDESATLEDYVYGQLSSSKAEIREFLDWSKGDFKLTDNGKALTIEQQVIQGNFVITEGYFNPFSYEGLDYGPWKFVIWLEFNDEGKIVEQMDWINYTPKSQFLGGKNLNRKLLQSN
jgi:hypothetical protein